MSLSDHPTGLITADEIDDLIYFARTADLTSLREAITTHTKTHSCSALSILSSAIDIDSDGLGSGSSLLHYPAANGNTEVIRYLLSLSTNNPTHEEDGGLILAQNDNKKAAEIDSRVQYKFINHQNVSGNTALHWAGMNGHIEVVKLLVGAGADLELVNAAGRDAVFEADISSKPGAAECAVEMLKVYEGLEKAKGNLKDDGGGQEDDNEGGVDGDGDGTGDEEGSYAEGSGVGKADDQDRDGHPT